MFLDNPKEEIEHLEQRWAINFPKGPNEKLELLWGAAAPLLPLQPPAATPPPPWAGQEQSKGWM